MKKKTAAVFAMAAMAAMVLLLATPKVATATDSFVYFLAERACSDKAYAGKNGCYAYLLNRIQCQSEDTALTNCKGKCADWYSHDIGDKTRCELGCKFLRDKD